MQNAIFTEWGKQAFLSELCRLPRIILSHIQHFLKRNIKRKKRRKKVWTRVVTRYYFWNFLTFPDQMGSFFLQLARRTPKGVWKFQCLCLSARRLDHNQRTVFNIFRSNKKILLTLLPFSLTFPWLSRQTIFFTDFFLTFLTYDIPEYQTKEPKESFSLVCTAIHWFIPKTNLSRVSIPIVCIHTVNQQTEVNFVLQKQCFYGKDFKHDYLVRWGRQNIPV